VSGASEITRNRVVMRFGTPHDTLGSVNEPRERDEHGARFNEKWIYRRVSDVGGPPQDRVVYWHRYNFVAAMLLDCATGDVRRENVEDFLASLDDRRYVPPDAAR
jgi:hypothetical protein